MTSALGPYSTSSALSTTHYKLAEALESARSLSEHDRILDECLHKIRNRWSRTLPKPSQAYNDLVLILFCRSQRNDPTEPREERQEWVLLGSVRLAGSIGVGSIGERQLGYRACMELFPPNSSSFPNSHPLKLLLINTIRSDLYAQDYDSKISLQRIKMALRAISSDALATQELVAAVEERLFELLLLTTQEAGSTGIRELALEALVSLAQNTSNSSSNLLNRTRETVLRLLLSASIFSTSVQPQDQSKDPLASSTSFSAYSRSRYELDSDLSSQSFVSSSTLSRSPRPRNRQISALDRLSTSFHLRLISHLSPTSALYPISASPLEGLQLFLPLLDKFVDTVSEKMQDVNASISMNRSSVLSNGKRSGFGKSYGFELERLLRVLEETLSHKCVSEEEYSDEERQETYNVIEEVKARMEVILMNLLRARIHSRESKNALILSLVRTISLLAPTTLASNSNFAPGILSPLFEYLSTSLIGSVSQASFDSNARSFVLKTLVLLPIEAWTGAESVPPTTHREKGKGKAREAGLDSMDTWGPESWRIIFDGLRDRDENLRRTTIQLLSRVDQHLLKLQYSKLVDSVPSARSEQAQTNLYRQLLELLPYLSSPNSEKLSARSLISPSRFTPPDRLVDLLRTPTLTITPVTIIPDLVLGVLNDFRYHFSSDEQQRFAMELWKLGNREAVDGNAFNWKENVMLGLLVAGTIHSASAGTETSEPGESLRMAEELSQWLTDSHVNREVKEMLSEPFLFALLRIVSLSLPTSPPETIRSTLKPEIESKLSSIKESISLLSTSTTDRTLDATLLDIAQRALESEESLSRLSRVGNRTDKESLADFGQALSKAFSLDSNLDHDQHHFASSATSNTKYQDSLTSRRISDSNSNASSDSTIGEKRGEARIEEISRSIAALKREQAELRRERQDRGGTTNSGNGKVESLMEQDTLGGRGTERKDIFSVSDEEEVDEEADGSVDRERETTFSTDGNGGNEPPSSLLIELTETLDPFHIH
ncbi:hypothetical protein JCM3765_001470 [Sporobolomyces pararoseus]